MLNLNHLRTFDRLGLGFGSGSGSGLGLGLGLGVRLMLNLNHLRTFDSELTSSFMRRPGEYLPAFEDALREVIVQQDPTLGKAVAMHEFRIGVEVGLGLG